MIRLADVLAGTGGALRLPPAGGTIDAPALDGLAFARVGIDSRTTGPGDLFVAVRGAVHDGHRFVPAAAARGASAALIEAGRADEFFARGVAVPLVEVPDTLVGLTALATYWRRQFTRGLHIVGVTGSVGKSSTKELAAAVVGAHRQVLKSPKSYNNEFGLPLSVLMIDEAIEVAILEMGTYGPGELTELADIARPTVAVVTNVGHSHLERMGTQEGIAAAKGELVAALPADGCAVLNGDDPFVGPMAHLTAARSITFGLGEGCDLRATDLLSEGLQGLSFTLHHGGAARRLARLPLLGRHSAYTALAAVGVGLAVGLTFDEAVAGLDALHERHVPVRLVLLPGPRGSTILDDSYNSSPASTRAALDILGELPAKRRLAVLGDMLELGAYEEEAHRQVGRWVAAVADGLVTIGSRARLIAEEAAAAGLAAARIQRLDAKAEALPLLRDELREGDLALVKGSRGLALEDLVAALVTPREPA
jgi:UDP-N-acetylmuramoyl-tripeptide--D-alanyl-D-alanine ligase